MIKNVITSVPYSCYVPTALKKPVNCNGLLSIKTTTKNTYCKWALSKLRVCLLLSPSCLSTTKVYLTAHEISLIFSSFANTSNDILLSDTSYMGSVTVDKWSYLNQPNMTSCDRCHWLSVKGSRVTNKPRIPVVLETNPEKCNPDQLQQELWSNTEFLQGIHDVTLQSLL